MLCLRKTRCSPKVDLGPYGLKGWEVTIPTHAHRYMCTRTEPHSHALSLGVYISKSLE